MTNIENSVLKAAHAHCDMHKSEILLSKSCGCFYCTSIFLPSEISDWTDSDQTALCPKCGVDSLIGSASGYPITISFLQEMRKRWFE